MKPKLLYCLALVATILLLSFTVISRQAKTGCILTCAKMEQKVENASESSRFIFFESLTKYLVISVSK